MNAHERAVKIERDRLLGDLEALERTPGATFAEARALREKIEHLELQIIWFQNAPRQWFD